MKFALGQPVPRTEDPRLLTGRGRYTDFERLAERGDRRRDTHGA
jgi:CO/xanthine dehydrogenase Mo-binding subunit